MQYIKLTTFLFCLSCTWLKSQVADTTLPIKVEEVPPVVMRAFNAQFPGLSGDWWKAGEDYKVEFTDKIARKSQVVFFDEEGHVKRRESEMDMAPLPDTTPVRKPEPRRVHKHGKRG